MPAVNVRTKIDFIVRVSPRRLVPSYTPFACPLLRFPSPCPCLHISATPLNPSFTHALFYSPAPIFHLLPSISDPLPFKPSNGCSLRSLHGSASLSLQEVSEDFSALCRRHCSRSRLGELFFRTLTFSHTSFSRHPRRRRRVLAGVTRIMDTSTQPSCVVVLYLTCLLVPTSPLLPRHLPPPQPPGWIISSPTLFTVPVYTLP